MPSIEWDHLKGSQKLGLTLAVLDDMVHVVRSSTVSSLMRHGHLSSDCRKTKRDAHSPAVIQTPIRFLPLLNNGNLFACSGLVLAKYPQFLIVVPVGGWKVWIFFTSSASYFNLIGECSKHPSAPHVCPISCLSFLNYKSNSTYIRRDPRLPLNSAPEPEQLF